jgi:hypothetical protein
VSGVVFCSIEHWTQIASGVAAFAAALIWLRAALTKLPPLPASPQNIDAFYAAAVLQSRLNAWAAGWTAVVAILQFFIAFMPTCWSGPSIGG